MHDARPMDFLQPGAELIEIGELLLEADVLTRGDDRREGGAVDELHRDEELSVSFLTDLVDRDKVLMPQVRRRPGFLQKSLDQLGIARWLRENLDGNLARGAVIVCEVDRPHAAVTQTAHDLVLADTGR